MNRGIRSLAVRVGVTALTLCAIGCGVSAGREEAEALAEQDFTKIQSGDIESVLSLYSAKFYAVTSRADWSALLQEQRDRCGKPKTHTMVSWNVVISFGSNSWNLNIWNGLGIPLALKHHARFHAAKSRLRLLDSIVLFCRLRGEHHE